MVFDTNLRKLWAILAIPGALLAIGAGYERGGLGGLRDLTLDMLHSVGIYRNEGIPKPDLSKPSATLPADEIFWLTIKESRAPALFGEFLQKFPNSPHAPEARAKWEPLKNSPQTGADRSRMLMREGAKMMMSPGIGEQKQRQ